METRPYPNSSLIFPAYTTDFTWIIMMRYLFLCLLTLLSGCTLVWPSNNNHQQQDPDTLSRICTEADCIHIEIADTDASRQQGLMRREDLPIGSGMLFIFEQTAHHAFWMKNTLLDLDIIWLDEMLTIVDIQTVPPCTTDPCPSYTPAQPSRFVLELNAQTATSLGRTTGTQLILGQAPLPMTD